MEQVFYKLLINSSTTTTMNDVKRFYKKNGIKGLTFSNLTHIYVKMVRYHQYMKYMPKKYPKCINSLIVKFTI